MFSEFSEISDQDTQKGIRLNTIADVQHKLNRTNSPLIVIKPLVESHQAALLIDSLNNATGVWQYRHYIDVSISDNIKFPNTSGFGNIKFIIDGDITNWRSAGLSKETISIVKKFHKKGLTNFEASCLFWWVRNTLYFDQNLDVNPKFFLINYTKFVESPSATIDNIYKNINICNCKVNTTVVGLNVKGAASEPIILDDLKVLCDDMYLKLTSSNKNII